LLQAAPVHAASGQIFDQAQLLEPYDHALLGNIEKKSGISHDIGNQVPVLYAGIK
jgi:hypothetical protein